MRNIVLLLFVLVNQFVYSNNFSISGSVVDEAGNSIPFATIAIMNTQIGVMSNENGRFILLNVPEEEVELSISCVGYASVTQKVNVLKDGFVEIILGDSDVSLNEIVVTGETNSTKLQKTGFAVSSIDATELQGKSIEINDVLDQTPGLRVRQDGGLGSQTQYNINGLSGNAVRIFIDGVPMESFGASYSVNSIPVSLIERVDVYKGVVPIEFGNDAMGGAINIVTKQPVKNQYGKSALNTSYSYGSFNTYRTDLNGTWRNDKTGLTTRFSGFYNYSDNNYEVWSDDIKITDYNEFLPDGSRNPNYLKVIDQGVRVKRFNDAYESYGGKVDFGVTDKKWADQLFVSLNMSGDYNQQQHGPRMITPYGERYTEGWTTALGVNYTKSNFLLHHLDVSSNLQYSQSQRSLVDTTTNSYDWYGRIISLPQGVTPLPGESGTASLNIDDNKNYIGRFSAAYRFHPNHLIGLNYSYNQYNRSSDDEMREAELRNYGSINKVNKQITGLTYQNTLFDSKLRNSVFVKHYYNRLSQDRIEYDGSALDTLKSNRVDDHWGYGATLSYAPTQRVRFNLSAEKAVRLVHPNEVFGNVSQEIIESSDLNPETSTNLNAGGIFDLIKNNGHKLELNTNFFYRNTNGRIRRTVVTVADDSYSLFENIGHVRSVGAEAQLSYRINQNWYMMLQGYYLDSRFMEEYDQNGSINLNYKSREPNMPYLTSNAAVSYSIGDVFNQNDKLSLNWNFAYVHQFYFDWDILGNQNKPLVPGQYIHDVGVSYRFSNQKLTLSLDGRNIFDSMAFDNYGVQKPGQGFYLKLSYSVF